MNTLTDCESLFMIHHQHVADEVLGAGGDVIPLAAGEAVLALHDLADHLQPLSENSEVNRCDLEDTTPAIVKVLMTMAIMMSLGKVQWG